MEQGRIWWSLRSRATPLRLLWHGLPDETPLNWYWQPLVQWNRNRGKRYDQNYASGTKPSSPAKQSGKACQALFDFCEIVAFSAWWCREELHTVPL